jgi:phage shock protein C
MTCGRCFREIDAESAYCRFCGAATRGTTSRRLVRLPADGQIAGVCAGIAAYLDTDVTLVRLAWVILSVVPGLLIGGVIAYLGAWILIPEAAIGERSGYTGRRLVRSTTDARIAGVCGGVADYLGVDATVVRVLFVVLSIYPGAVIGGLIAYAIAWIVIPEVPLKPVAVPADHRRSSIF